MKRYIKDVRENSGAKTIKIFTYKRIESIFFSFDQPLVMTCLVNDISKNFRNK
jgi:hypothetical protein